MKLCGGRARTCAHKRYETAMCMQTRSRRSRRFTGKYGFVTAFVLLFFRCGVAEIRERNEVHARGPAFKAKCVIISDIILARGVRVEAYVQHLIKSSDRARARAEGHRPFRCDADGCCSCS